MPVFSLPFCCYILTLMLPFEITHVEVVNQSQREQLVLHDIP
jgi:hypothetical protein